MNSKLKIGFITHIHLNKDNCKTSIIEIIKNLSKRGNKTDLIVPSIPKNSFKYAIEDIIYLFSLDINFLSSIIFSISLFFYLPFYILKKKPDIIILDAPCFFGGILVMFISKMNLIKTKFIFDVRSTPVDTKGIHGFFYKLQYFISIFLAKYLSDGITFLTERMAKAECKNFGIRDKPIEIWTSGVDEELFNPILYRQKSVKLRKKLCLENKFIIFYHGILSPNRGLQNTIKAINLLKKDHQNIVFFLLGGGVVEKEIKKLVKENNLQKNVILHSSVDYKEVPKYISMIDVGIVPLPHHQYWNNQSPLKVMEYLSMEKPIILTNIPAHLDIIKKEKCGILIRSHSPEDIKKGIIKAYENRKNFKILGKIGRKIILKKYNWGKIAKHLEIFLMKVKNEKK